MQVNSLYKIIFIILLLLSYDEYTLAQTWQSLNGPIESEVTDIIVQDDTVYTAARFGHGLYKRNFESDVWQFSNITQGEGAFRHALEDILSINIDEQGNYYAGGGGVMSGDGQVFNQFYKSHNYGKSWQEFRNGIEDCHTVSDILVTPDKNMFIACVQGIFLFSENENKFIKVGGNAWEFVHTLYQYENMILAGTQSGLWYSDNDGLNWIENENDEHEIFAIKRVEDEFFLGTDNGLFRTSELTESWVEVDELSGLAINAIHLFEDLIYIANETGVYVVNPDNYSTAPVFADIAEDKVHVINSSESSLFVGAENGFYICSPEQNTCTLNGVASAWVRSLSFQGQDTLLTSTTNAIYRYFTESGEWDTQSVPLRRTRNIVPIDEENFRTIDDRNYYKCSFAEGECDSFEIDEEHVLRDITENSAGQLFVASLRYVYQSDDGGDTWDMIYNHPNNDNHTLKANGDSLLFINGAIKLSLDTHDVEQLPASVHHITSDGKYFGIGNSGVVKSHDFGETWITLLQSTDIIEPDFIRSVEVDESSNKIYAITNTGRVYVSENEGENWGLNIEMRPVAIEHTVLGPDGILYLGSFSAGVFANVEPLKPPMTISIEEEPGEAIPNNVILHQNYPNPFNPVTVISFQLPASSEVTLEVFDLLGRRVALLVDGRQTAGTHTVHFDGSNLSSGTYIYRLQTEDFSEVRKMTLIK